MNTEMLLDAALVRFEVGPALTYQFGQRPHVSAVPRPWQIPLLALDLTSNQPLNLFQNGLPFARGRRPPKEVSAKHPVATLV